MDEDAIVRCRDLILARDRLDKMVAKITERPEERFGLMVTVDEEDGDTITYTRDDEGVPKDILVNGFSMMRAAVQERIERERGATQAEGR